MAKQADKAIRVGVQLYSIRQVIKKDVAGHLNALGEMGYDGVEFAGYYGKSATELRKMLDDAGLKCCGTHTGLDTLLGDNLKRTVEFNQTLGNRYLIVPWLKMKTKQECLDKAKQFNEIAAAIRDQGMVTGYHAHGHDFHALEGSTPWDLLFSNTNTEVSMQLDTGNCMGGGGKPLEYLKKYPGRSFTIHFKEHGGGVVGEGKVPWKEVMSLCRTTGKTEWYIIEEERSGEKSMETVKRALQNLRKMMA